VALELLNVNYRPTVCSQLTYAGSKGTKLYTFFNGNQAAPDPNPNDATAPRRPVFATLIGSPGSCALATSSVLRPGLRHGN
jgi:hypothetical protein